MIWLRNTSIDPSALIDEARARSTGRFKSDPAASASKKASGAELKKIKPADVPTLENQA